MIYLLDLHTQKLKFEGLHNLVNSTNEQKDESEE